jgi:streptogramin lyase
MGRSRLLLAALVAALSGASVTCGDAGGTHPDAGDGTDSGPARRYSKIFTSDEDFAAGVESGVNHTSQPNQMQMNMGRTVFETPFIWIPNSTDNTVTQVDTMSGVVIGSYPLEKGGIKCTNPSRTTVNEDNDVWIACRGSANIIKISHQTGQAMLLVPLEGVPRGIAIDATRKLWVGCGDDELNDLDPVYKIDEVTGECLMGNQPGCVKPPLQVADWPYGAAVDQRGYLWELSNHHWTNGTLTKIDTTTDTIVGTYKRTPIPTSPRPNDQTACSLFYGIAIDQLGDVWTGNHTCNDVLKFNGQTGAFIAGYPSGGQQTRGVAVDLDGNIWVANSGTHTATKLNGRTGDILYDLNVGTHPIGIGVDAYGHVWAVNLLSNNVYKINGVTLEKEIIPVGTQPYTYSDMLGTALRTITLRRSGTAYWTVNYDTGLLRPTWRDIRWGAEEPEGTRVRVRTRCAATQADLYTATFSEYLDMPGPIVCAPERFIQIEVEFSASEMTASPVLKDLTVIWED